MKIGRRLAWWCFFSCWVVAQATACTDLSFYDIDPGTYRYHWQTKEPNAGNAPSLSGVSSVLHFHLEDGTEDAATCAQHADWPVLLLQAPRTWHPILQQYLSDPLAIDATTAQQAMRALHNELPGKAGAESLSVLAAITAELLFYTYQFEFALKVLDQYASYASRTEITSVMQLLEGNIFLRQRENVKAIAILDRLFNDPSLPFIIRFRAGLLVGEAYLDDNQINAGRRVLERSEALLELDRGRAVHSDDIITLYDNLGFLHIKLAQQTPAMGTHYFDQALKYELKALAVANNNNNIKQQVTIHSNIAWLESRRHNYPSSQYHLLTLLVLLQSYQNPDLEAFTYQSVATVYFRLGEYSKAAAYLNGAIERVGDNAPKIKTELQCRLAQSLLRSGVTTAAQSLVDTCYQDAMQRPEYAKQVISLVASLDAIDAGLHLSDSADQIKQQLGERATQNIDTSLKAEAVLKLAELAVSDGNINDAVDWLNTLDFDQLQVASLLAVKARKLLFELMVNQGRPDTNEFAESTHGLIVSQLQAMSGNDISAAWRHSVNDFYALWFDFLLARNSEFANRQVVEYVLLLNELNVRQQPFTVDASHRQRINAVNTQRFDQGKAQLSLQLQQMLELDLLRHASLYSTQTKQASAYDSPNLTSAACGEQHCLDKLQSSLKPNERVLLFVPGEERVTLAVIGPTSTALYPVSSLQQISEQASRVTEALVNRNQAANTMLTHLAQRLFAPILNSSVDYTWYIVGHVPVDSLSINALMASLPNPPSKFTRVMSFQRAADKPLRSLQQPNVRVIATQQISGQQSELSSLNALPWAKVEADNIQSALKPNPVNVLLNEAATDLALFAEDSRTADVLHIAAHNIHDPNEPDVVGLALNQAGSEANGGALIDIRAIEHSGFVNQLVFLNACDTGNGRDYDGVGSLSLARAFLQSGAQQVIATKWPIVDRASGVFAAHFYRALNTEGNASDALSLAISEMRNSRRYKHPYYWAGYELTQRRL